MQIALRVAPTREETHRMLTVLGKYMAIVPPERFHMYGWFSTTNGAKVLQPPHVPQCHTSACVGGWATTIKEFQDAGLHLTLAWRVADSKQPVTRNMSEMVCKFFGVTIREADEIFFSDAMTPKAKSKQILAIARRYR